jgi:hypothetical protein
MAREDDGVRMDLPRDLVEQPAELRHLVVATHP